MYCVILKDGQILFVDFSRGDPSFHSDCVLNTTQHQDGQLISLELKIPILSNSVPEFCKFSLTIVQL